MYFSIDSKDLSPGIYNLSVWNNKHNIVKQFNVVK
jgi:hypothetical protein